MREETLKECAEICAKIEVYFGSLAEGKEEPEFSQFIARESAARVCKEAINRKLLVYYAELNDINI
jgi:Fe-S-cluster-containing dehydrogenase component